MPDARGGIAGAIRKKNDVSRHGPAARRPSCALTFQDFSARIPRILLGNLASTGDHFKPRRRCACLPLVTSELVSDLTTSALLVTRGVPLRKHGNSFGLLRDRDARNSALREGLICVMQLTRRSSNLTNWPAMSDRIHPVLFFILRGLNR
jgi:hypothetical protein